MRTEMYLVDVAPDLLKVVGRQRKGTCVYHRQGKEADDEYNWYKALSGKYHALVDPASASRLVGVSRNAVYKRIKNGSLTAFFFKAPPTYLTMTDTRGRMAIGRVRIKFRAHVNCLIPFEECERWRNELHSRRTARRVAPFGGRGIMMYGDNYTVEAKRYSKGTTYQKVSAEIMRKWKERKQREQRKRRKQG